MKAFSRVLLFVLGILFLFSLGFGWRDIQQGKAPDTSAFGQLLGLSSSASVSQNATDVFKKAFDDIRKDYYKPVESLDLKYAGLTGMMASLGDPHTQFLSPKDTASFRLETDGHFAGVGARLSPDPLGARVVSVFEQGPADRAGLRKDDLITGVNGKTVSGVDIDDIVRQVRGEPGTWVSLMIVRQTATKPITIKIQRANVITPTVESKVLPGTRLGYISISIFSQPTGEQFERALGKLEHQGIKGLIIDVRDNPGGLLDTAVDMLSLYVEDKVVVKMKGREGDEEVAKTTRGLRRRNGYPIAVLINEDSASAAEIFSGVLHDYRLATLVGNHSYGKASVQNVIPLIDGASAKITIAKYFLPSGKDISRKVDEYGGYASGGIQPDVKADWPPQAEGTNGDLKTDPQLKKAVEVLKSKVGASVFLPNGKALALSYSAPAERDA